MDLRLLVLLKTERQVIKLVKAKSLGYRNGYKKLFNFLFVFLAHQPPVGHGLLIHELSR